MKSAYQSVAEDIEAKRRIIYSGLSRLDSCLIRLNGNEKDAFGHLVNHIKSSDSQRVSMLVKEIQQIRALKNKIKTSRSLLLRFCEKNQI